jgi:hypothetical protein
MAPKQKGPFEIEEVLGPVTYQLKLPESWQIHKVFFHAALLRPYWENEVYGENYIQPLPDIEEGEEVYEVEQILKHRKRGRGYECLVRWVGYPITKASGSPNQTLLVQLIFFKNTKNSTSCKPHAILWKIEVYSKSPPTKPCTLEQPWGVSENKTPHERHAPGICIYVSTISTLLTPHSSLTPPSTSWTQTKQINQNACHLNSHPTTLCFLCLLLLLLWKLHSWSTYAILLHTNSQDLTTWLWTIT